MNVVIIQPPLVQLNTPYPAGAYLTAFFRTTGIADRLQDADPSGTSDCVSVKPPAAVKDSYIRWFDLSTGLFHEIFCSRGLRRLFTASSASALALAAKAERAGDDNTAFQLRRYLSEEDLWCSWIDRIVSMVCGPSAGQNGISGHEWVHEFVRSAHVPRGMRMEQYLSSLKRDVGADDARILASLALADLADYITAAFDGNFELVRYAERIAASTSSFGSVVSALDAPVLTQFYGPLLGRSLASLELHTPALFCISVPFPGTFAAAVYTAREIKRRYGTGAVTAIGGGYVNTELRNVHEPELFDYIDFISYDRGYGSFLSLFDAAAEVCGPQERTQANPLAAVFDGRQFYKIKYRHRNTIVAPLLSDRQYEEKENSLTRTLVPDFSDIDFSQSPRLADDTNPMHRIWSDGAWLKAYLAYGCYWHRCAFCDTTLEYVYGYCKTDVRTLYVGLHEQAEKAGVYGIHFVDEACPPVALQEFALANCAADRPEQNQHKLTFWGNIRFEKTFSRDLADLLSCGGMTGVSAGIEIATGRGLSAVNKGTDMEHIVAACAAFKEAGILVHGYMIYGFPGQNAQDLADSMETLRQMFVAGLLDSAFWHKFTLTRHSTVFREWQNGMHPDLKPLDLDKDRFAENDIRFEGEEKSEKYGTPLNTAVECWMHGSQIEKKIQDWFDFRMPPPSIPRGYIAGMTATYEQQRDSAFTSVPRENDGSRYVWLGGSILLPGDTEQEKEKKKLCWEYMGDMLYADVPARQAVNIVHLLESIYIKNGTPAEGSRLASQLGKTLFTELRGKGLCRLL